MIDVPKGKPRTTAKHGNIFQVLLVITLAIIFTGWLVSMEPKEAEVRHELDTINQVCNGYSTVDGYYTLDGDKLCDPRVDGQCRLLIETFIEQKCQPKGWEAWKSDSWEVSMK